MDRKLRILLIEDSENDAALIIREIERHGYEVEFERVDTAQAMQSALADSRWDVIISDYSMPNFDVYGALHVMQECGQDLPFILASGTVGEETAVEALKAGAHDFVIKDHLARLVPAIERELKEAGVRIERRRADQELQEWEQRFRSVLDHMLEGFQIISFDWKYLYVNEAALRHGHHSRQELEGHTIMEVYPGIEETALFTALQRCMEERTPQAMDKEFAYPDGSRSWLHLLIQPTLDGISISSTDITDRRRAEKALLESEERYRLLFDSNPMPMWIYDTADLHFLAVNDAAIQHYGYTGDEFLNMTIMDIRPENELPRLKADLASPRQQRESSGVWKHRKKDGTLIDVEILSYDIQEVASSARLVLANDITERKRAEQALTESEERFRLLFETSPDAIFLLDMDDHNVRLPIVDCNEAACRMNGYTREELLGRSIELLEASHSDILVLDTWVAEQIREKGLAHLQTTHRHKDGHTFPLEVSISRLRIGGRTFSLSIERDISERKQAEDALRQSQANLAAAQRITHLGSWEMDLTNLNDINSNSVHWSDEVFRIFGYEPGQIGPTNENFFKAVHPEDRESISRAMSEAIQSGNRYRIDYHVIRTDGSVRIVHELAEIVRDADGRPTRMVGTVQDITERREIEAQLADALDFTDHILTSSPVGILTYKFSGECLSANDFAANLVGTTVEALRQQNFRKLDSWKKSGLSALAEKAMSSRTLQTSDIHLISSFGKESWLRAQFVTFKSAGEDVLLLAVSDITERKGAEVALREAEARYRGLVEHLPMVVYIASEKEIAHTIYVSPQIESVLGYTVAEWLAEPTFRQKSLHPEDLSPVMEKAEAARRTGQPFSTEYRMFARDGRMLWFLDDAVLIRDDEGHPLFWQGLMIDITERKHAEEMLKQRDEELQKRNLELERLYHASESLLVGALADLPTLARNIVDTLLREFEQSNCSLFLVNKETGELERIAVAGPYAENVSRAKLSLDRPGLVAKAIRAKQVINVNDVTVDPDYVPNWEAARSELVIPLKIGEDVIGALDVQSPERAAFHADDERLMTIFGERAAFGLERTRLHEQTKKQLGRLEGLRTIDLAISNSLDLRISLNIVLEQVMVQLGVDAASVLLFKPGLGRLEYVAGRGFRTRLIESSNLRMGEGYAGRAALEKEMTHLKDFTADRSGLARQEMFLREEFVSYFGVPLIAKGEVKGLLEIFHRKPIRPDMEWLNFLDALGWQTAIAVDNALLFEGIQRSNFDLALAYDATIEGWSKALDLRDKETEGHTQRVIEMTLKLAEAIGFQGEELVHIKRGALLHDMGKLGVPDHILHKPGPLTDEEWVMMKRHPQFAYDMFHSIAYLKEALHIPYCHHERWDGTGYPRGLSGTLIPVEARLFAVVVVWDALTNDRPYRKKWSKRKALEYIREQSGKQFDPQVVEKFIEEIASKLRR